MSKYTTGEIAKLCGVTVRTVQYYDSRGILTPSELSEGGRRLYSEADLKQMKTVCFLRELGLPINSIAQLLCGSELCGGTENSLAEGCALGAEPGNTFHGGGGEMKSLLAFVKKDCMEQLRSFKLLILLGVFVLLGIMNPAVAKLTPVIMDAFSEVLAESGMSITAAPVTAMDSWVQYFKNIPLGLIAFIVLESSIFTKEYSSGTMVLALTKGLERWKVLASKALVLIVLWSACYWLSFAVSYGITAYLWDNSVAVNLGFAVMCWWLAGLLAVLLSVLFSKAAKSNITVLAGTGGTFLAIYLISLIHKLGEFSPAKLMEGMSLLTGAAEIADYTRAIVVTIILIFACFALSVPIFNKKQI